MTEPSTLRPDDVLTPDGRSVRPERGLSDAALLLPRIVKLVGRLILDPRVPRRSKITLAVAVGYVASPVDLMPDVVPPFKWLDEVLVLMFAIDTLMQRAGPEVVADHWDGPGDQLTLIQDVVGLSRFILPRRVSFVVDRLTA